MVDVIIDSAGLPKGRYMDFVSPIQMPVFPYWIYIGVNDADDLFISLRRFKIVCIFN